MRNRGITMMELLVVMVIIGVLAAVILPVINLATIRAERIRCQQNLLQLGVAFYSYAEDNFGRFPTAGAGDARKPTDWIWSTSDDNRGLTVDDINQGVLWPEYIDDLQVFRCPSDPTYLEGDPDDVNDFPHPWSYTMNCLLSRCNLMQPYDFASSFFLIEEYQRGDPYNPNLGVTDTEENPYYIDDGYMTCGGMSSGETLGDYSSHPSPPTERHSGGANILFLDGHVEWVYWPGRFKTTNNKSLKIYRKGMNPFPGDPSPRPSWATYEYGG